MAERPARNSEGNIWPTISHQLQYVSQCKYAPFSIKYHGSEDDKFIQSALEWIGMYAQYFHKKNMC